MWKKSNPNTDNVQETRKSGVTTTSKLRIVHVPSQRAREEDILCGSPSLQLVHPASCISTWRPMPTVSNGGPLGCKSSKGTWASMASRTRLELGQTQHWTYWPTRCLKFSSRRSKWPNVHLSWEFVFACMYAYSNTQDMKCIPGRNIIIKCFR